MRTHDVFSGRRYTIAHLQWCLFVLFFISVLTVIMCIVLEGSYNQTASMRGTEQNFRIPFQALSKAFEGQKTETKRINSRAMKDTDFQAMDEWQRQANATKSKRRVGKNSRFIKEDNLLPLKIMFANAGRKHIQRSKSMTWNNSQLPLEDLKEVSHKPQVLLLVIVSSAPKRQDRRKAIRHTWWKKCIGQVKCVFFTDGLQVKRSRKRGLLVEHYILKDIKFSPTEDATMILGERFLFQIMWAKAKFSFQYILRLDDDYFVCMDRLVNEFPSRPKTNLSWGFYHCQYDELVYMDESWALFSEDVIQQFLAQNLSSMMCHGFGDQTYSMWMNATRINLTQFHDSRLHYWPPAGKLRWFYETTDVCDNHIGIHGSYPELMGRLWLHSNDQAHKNVTELSSLNSTCSLPKIFNVYKFEGIYKMEPKPCLERPRWRSGLTSWEGSENIQFYG